MKILSAEQIRKADQFTIENEPIPSIDLMERASMAFTEWFVSKFDKSFQVTIFCGSGNNGGDGLAVARLLLSKQYSVSAYVISTGKKGSPDFEKNRDRLEDKINVQEISKGTDFPLIQPGEIVIDAIFGSGLVRKVEGLYAEVIDNINASNATVVSIDIPSGLFCDELVENPAAVKSQFTASFQMPKRNFFYRENSTYVGEWNVLDIGLDQKFIFDQDTSLNWLEEEMIKPILKKRDRHSHKGNFGHSLLVAGSKGKMGAAILASKACLRSGAGLLSIMVPSCGTQVLQMAVPEAMVAENLGSEFLNDQEINFENFNAIGVGPGLGQENETRDLLTSILEGSEVPLVLDADAINLLGANRELLEIVPKDSILTPHPKEFERLAGSYNNSREMIELQKEFSQKGNVFVILKGGYTSISTPQGEVFFNTTGNPGMSTAGAGDVLTGIVTGMLAQGYTPLQSALLSVFLHSKAGDLVAEEASQESLIASDIISKLGAVFRLLSK